MVISHESHGMKLGQAVSFKLVNNDVSVSWPQRWHFHRWNKWWNWMKQIMRALRLVAVSCTDVNPDGSPRWLRLASIVATLNQVVGAVYLERVLQADKADNADNASASQHHDEKNRPVINIHPVRKISRQGPYFLVRLWWSWCELWRWWAGLQKRAPGDLWRVFQGTKLANTFGWQKQGGFPKWMVYNGTSY